MAGASRAHHRSVRRTFGDRQLAGLGWGGAVVVGGVFGAVWQGFWVLRTAVRFRTEQTDAIASIGGEITGPLQLGTRSAMSRVPVTHLILPTKGSHPGACHTAVRLRIEQADAIDSTGGEKTGPLQFVDMIGNVACAGYPPFRFSSKRRESPRCLSTRLSGLEASKPMQLLRLVEKSPDHCSWGHDRQRHVCRLPT